MSYQFKYEVVSLADILKNNDLNSYTETPRATVLVVDDEKLIADTLSIILTKQGYEVLTAYNASSALDMAYETPPDLLLSDVMMPGMNGIDLAITLTRAIPQCKVLLFSGQAATVDHLAMARAMGYDFNVLTKPVHPSEMLRSIAERLASGMPQSQMLAMD